MAPLAELVNFVDFCGLLRRLKKSTKASDRKREFEKFFKQYKSDVSFQNEELLPFLRIILSTMDSERRFDIKHKKLAQRVGKLLGVTAGKLVCFDTMGAHKAVEKLASEVVGRITKVSGDLSVATVSDRLDRMADREIRCPDDSDFEYLFQHCGAEELVWIFNIIIRNVESYIGASSASLMSMLDDDAMQRWTHCRSLTALVDDTSPSDSILGRNIRPMLLARLPRLTDWWGPIAAHSGKEFFVEMKYDGEHVLLHRMNKDNYKYFTRNGKDFSNDYGATSTEGTISNRIHSFFLDSCVDCVLDCELVMYDNIKKKIIRHNTAASDGKTHSFRHIHSDLDKHVQLAVVLFDILHYNGRSLLNVPLEERVKVLEKGVLKRQAEDNIYIAKRHVMSTRSEVEDFFAEAMKNDEEGIVVKSMSTLYKPGSRATNNGWYKLKPNLSSSCSIDLAVVAILKGQGKEGRDAYLIAAREEHSSKLRIVGSVSVGLTDLDRKRIYEDATLTGALTAEPHESVRGRRIEGSKGGFIHPHHMNVVEVTCTGVREGKLVDPVVRCIREKSLDEIDSTEQFEELAEVLRQCRLPDEEEAKRKEEAEQRKRKKGAEGVIPVKREKKAESEETEGDSPLTGRTVCVLQGVDSKARERAFQILARFGAKNVANPVDGTDLVVAVTRAHPRTRTVAAKGQWTVVECGWLERCDKEGKIVKWTDKELIHLAPGTFEIE